MDEMINAAEIPSTSIEYTPDPEVPMDPAASLPEPEEVNARPAPEVTTMDPWPADVEKPRAVGALEKRAKLAGWEFRTGYARGFVDGRARGTFKLVESIVVWLRKDGQTRRAFAWERDPGSKAAVGPSWKPTNATEFSFVHGQLYVRVMNHTEGKALLCAAPTPEDILKAVGLSVVSL